MSNFLKDGIYNADLADVKRDALQQAVERKANELAKNTPEGKMLVQAHDAVDKWAASQEKAWVTDFQRANGSLPDGAANIAASAIEGTADFAGRIASAPHSIQSAHQLNLVDDDARAAYAKLMQGEPLSEAEMAALNRKNVRYNEAEGFDSFQTPEPVQDKLTQKELIETSLKNLKDSDDIEKWWTEDTIVDGIFNDTGVQAFAEDLGDTYDNSGWAEAEGFSESLSAAGSLVAGWAGNVWDNPLAVMELMGEEAPDIAAGLLGGVAGGSLLAASSAGEAVRIYRDGINAYMEENNGQLPDRETHQDMVEASIAAGALEYVADNALVHSIKGGVAEKISKLVGNKKMPEKFTSIISKVGGIGTSSAVEGTTEGAQNALGVLAEGKTLDDVDGREVFIDAGLGGSVGGGFGSIDATKSVLSATKDILSNRKNSDEKLLKNQKVIYNKLQQKEAVSDTILEQIDISKGLDNVTLVDNISARLSQDAQSSDPAVSQNAKDSASHFVSELKLVFQQLGYKAAELKTKEQETSLSKKEQKLKRNLETLGEAMFERIVNLNAVSTFDSGNPDTQESKVDQFTSAKEEGAKDLIIESIDSNNTFADELLNNASDEQIASITSKMAPGEVRFFNAYMAANQAREQLVEASGKKTLSQVNSEVVFGRGDKKGAEEYRQKINQAVKANDAHTANTLYLELNKFRDLQTQKLSDFKAALTKAIETNRSVTVGGDHRTTDKKTGKEVPYVMYPPGTGRGKGSQRLVDTVAAEVAVLNAEVQLAEERMVRHDMKVKPVNTEASSSEPVASAPSAEPEGEQAKKPKAKTHKSQQKKKDAPPSPPLSAYEDPVNSVETTEPSADPETETEDDGRPALSSPEDGDTVPPDVPRNDDGSLAFAQAEPEGEVVYDPEADFTEVSEEAPAYLDDAPPIDDDLAPLEEEETTEELTDEDKKVQKRIGMINEMVTSLKNVINRTRAIQNDLTRFMQAYNTAKEKDPKLTTANFNKALNAKVKDTVAKIAAQRTALAKLLGMSEPSGQIGKELTQQTSTSQDGNYAFTQLQVKGATLINSVRDVIGSLKENPNMVYFFSQREIAPEHRTILNHFTEFAEQQMIPAFDSLFKFRNNFAHQNFVQFFADEDGNVEPNVKAALAAAVYDWVINEGEKSLFKTREDVAKMLYGDKNHPLDDGNLEYYTFMQAGHSKNLMAQKLGKQAMKMLGLEPTFDAASNIGNKFEQALGEMALAMMIESEMVEATNIPIEMFGGKPKLDAKGNVIAASTHTVFFRARGNEHGEQGMHTYLAQIKGVNQNTQSFFSSIFDPEHESEMPSFRPPLPSKKDEKYKGTTQILPKKLRENKDKYQQQAWNYSEETAAFWESLTDEQKLAQAGYNFEADREMERLNAGKPLQSMHISDVQAAVAVNEGLKRELENLTDFVKGMQKNPHTPFYFNHEVWKMGRMGLKGSKINPQSFKKIQRGLITNTKWKTTIDPTDPKMVNRLMMAIGLGLDLKNGADKGVDKMTVDDAVATLKDNLAKNTKGLKDAVEAMKRFQTGQHSPEDLQVITDAVAAFGEGTHSLQSITALAKLDAAMPLDGSAGTNAPFTTDIPYEIDGVTNGVMIGLMALVGKASPKLLEQLQKGGIFSRGETSLGELFEQGLSDAYESLGAQWQEAMENFLAEPKNAKYRAYTKTVSRYYDYTKRKMAKDPLMRTVYGSGKDAMNRLIGSMFLDGIKSEILTIVNSPDLSDKEKLAALNHVQKDINAMAGERVPFNIAGLRDPKEALAIEFDAFTQNALRNRFSDTYGETLQNAIAVEFEEFADKRNHFNNVFKLASALYAKEFERLAKQRVNELNKDPNRRTDYEDLPKNEVKEIHKQLEQIHPALSTMMSEGMDDRLSLLKMDKEQVDDELTDKGNAKKGNGLYGHESSFAKALNFIPALGREENERPSSKSLRSAAQQKVISDPGMSPGVLTIQNIDSVIANLIVGSHNTLNVHDGFFVGLNEMEAAGRTLNQSFAQVVETQALGKRANEMIANLEAYIGKSKAKEKAMYDQIKEWSPEWVQESVEHHPVGWLADATRAFMDVDAEVEELLSKITGITQYNVEGGLHETGNQPEVTDDTPPWEVEAEQPVEYTPNYVESLFNGKRQSTLGEIFPTIVEELTTNTKAYGKSGDLFKPIYSQLLKTVNADTPVVLVAKGDQVEGFGDSRGMYDPNTNTIYLADQSWGEGNHGTNAITLAHEAIHSVISRMIQSSQRDKAAGHAIAGLESLLTQLKALPKKDLEYIAQRFPNAFDNIDELVAWGLTTPEFQKWLSTVTVKNPQGRFIKGWTAFVNAVSKAIFGKRLVADSPQMNTAMSELLLLSAEALQNAKEASNKGINFTFDPKNPHQANGEWKPAFQPQATYQTPDQVFNALHDKKDTTSVEHQQYLGELVHTLTKEIGGTMGIDLKEAEAFLGDHADQFIRRLADGDIPFISTLGDTFGLTAQEKYAAALTEITMREMLDASTDVQKETQRLWALAKDALSPADFANQAQYDAIFTPITEQVSSDFDPAANKMVTKERSLHLERFMALAATSETFRTLLEGIEAENEAQESGKGLLDRVKGILAKIIRYLGILTSPAQRLVGDRVDARLTNILRHTAELNIATKAGLNRTTVVSAAEDKLQAVVDKGRKRIVALADARRASNTRIPVVDTVAAGISLLGHDEAGEYRDTLHNIRARLMGNEKYGLIAQTIQSMTGGRLDAARFTDMLRWVKRNVEQAREHTRSFTEKLIDNGFLTPLSDAEDAAMAHAVLRTDLQALFTANSKITGKELADLLNPSNGDLTKRIARIEAILTQIDPENAQEWREQAYGLGILMMTGEARKANQRLNAGMIVKGDVTTETDPIKANQALPLVDALASLRALQQVSPEDRKLAAAVVEREFLAHDAINGVTSVMAHARRLREESRKEIFQNSEWNMIKGYTGEIMDGHISTAVIPEHELDDYVKQGWIPHGYPNHQPMYRDAGDPNNVAMYHVYRRDGGQQSWLSGLLSLTRKQRKGTTVTDNLQQAGFEGAYMRSQITTRKMYQAHTNASFDPNGKQKFAVPVYNAQGQVQAYRYLMNEQTKKEILGKRYSLSEMMGAHAASIVDKAATEKSNNEVIELMSQMYFADWEKGVDYSKHYAEISADSSDPKLREMWHMLPYEAKEKVIETFGRPVLPVRTDVQDLVTGYRKASIIDPLVLAMQKDKQDRTVLQHAVVQALHSMGYIRAAKFINRLKAVEDIWQEVMRFVKDVLVIRNVFTLVGNILSNTALLVWSGLSPFKAVAMQAEGAQLAQKYEQDERQLSILQAKLDAGEIPTNQRARTRAEISHLKNELAINKVRPLVEAGLLTGIVEDVETGRDKFSYASKIQVATAGFTDKIPAPLKNVAKVMTLAQDTHAYKFLEKTTRLSDFSARYAEYMHLINHPRKAVSPEDAIKTVMEDFVFYDVPDHKLLQYANDVGLVMFTKYYLRMQRVLLRKFKQHPLRGALLITGQNLVEITDPTDSVLWSRGLFDWLLNPLKTAFGAPDEIAPYNAMLHVVGVK